MTDCREALARAVRDLATARGVPESVVWLGLTGQPGPDTNSNPVRVEKSNASDAYRAGSRST